MSLIFYSIQLYLSRHILLINAKILHYYVQKTPYLVATKFTNFVESAALFLFRKDSQTKYQNYKYYQKIIDMPRCAASHLGCMSGKPGTEYVQMRGFPKDPGILQIWLQNLNRGEDWKPSITSQLCIRHFESDQFIPDLQSVVNGKKQFIKDPIPTIFGAQNPGKIFSETAKGVEI